MNDLISVIIPIYKSEQYLRACVDSIIGQTHRNLEIILVNDGSPDNSLEICHEYAAKDSRIKIINRQNGGQSAARNSGIEAATGDYITFVDSDDVIEPIMYEIMLKQIKETGSDIAQCGISSSEELQYIGNNEVKTFAINPEIIRWRSAVLYLLDSIPKFTSGVWNKLYRKELFDGIRFEYVRGEDFVMLYQLLNKMKPQIIRIDTPLYHYIKRGSSITTGSLKQSNFQFMELLHKMEEEEKDPEFLEHWKIQKAVSSRNILIRVIISGEFQEHFNSLKNNMTDAKFVIFNKKYRYIDKSLKLHILTILLSPNLYRMIIKKKINKNKG